MPLFRDNDDYIATVYPQIRGYVERTLDKKGYPGDPDDYVSFCILKLLTGLRSPNYQEEYKKAKNKTFLGPLVRSIVRRGIIDYYRQEYVTQGRQATPLSDLPLTAYPTMEDPPPLADQRLLEACTDTEDELLVRMAARGHDRKEIADWLGVPQRYIRERARRIEERL